MIDIYRKKIQTFFSEKECVSLGKYNLLVNEETDKPQAFFYYLISGYVRNFIYRPQGEIFSITLEGPGKIIPIILNLLTMQGLKLPELCVESITPIVAYKCKVEELQVFFTLNSEIYASLLQDNLKIVQMFVNRIPEIVYGQTDNKVADFLLYLARNYSKKEDKIFHIQVPLIHKDISTFTGTSRESVSLALNRLEEKGIIKNTKTKISILNIDKLEDIKMSR